MDNTIKITNITQTKQGRYALFVEPFGKEEFLFSVDEETLYKYKIKQGSLLMGEELMFIKQSSETKKAKLKAVEYLSMRDYGEKELYLKLRKKFDTDSVEFAVSEMIRLNLIDDEKFAKNRVESLIRKGKSKGEISIKLYELGIAKDIISAILEDVDIDEITLVEKLVEKSYKTKLSQGKESNVISALLRRGFAMRDIKQVLEQYKN